LKYAFEVDAFNNELSLHQMKTKLVQNFRFKMRTITFIIFIVLTSVSLYCKSQIIVPILSDSNLVPGIYTSFDEFKQNKPSIRIQLQAIPDTTGTGVRATFIQYRLETKEKQQLKNKEIWGFSDGRDVYKKRTFGIWRRPHIFSRIESFGRYCFYLDFKYTGGYYAPIMNPATGMMSPGGYGGGRTEVGDFIINLNTGKNYEVTQSLVEIILAQDTELWKNYDKDPNRIDNLAHYVWQYSQKHPEEIK
jgi:hypothetical protein